MTCRSVSATTVIPVIDPLNRNGKTNIPMKFLAETRGLLEYLDAPVHQRKDLSLCLLFQKGRCNAAARCHQIHAASEFIEERRRETAVSNSCCARHGDVFSSAFTNDSKVVTVVSAEGLGTTYPITAFARTDALMLALSRFEKAGVPAKIPANKICRLHAQNRCKFGQDCKNVHLCRSAQKSEATAPVRRTPPPSADYFHDMESVRSAPETELCSTRSACELPSMRTQCGDISIRCIDEVADACSECKPLLAIPVPLMATPPRSKSTPMSTPNSSLSATPAPQTGSVPTTPQPSSVNAVQEAAGQPFSLFTESIFKFQLSSKPDCEYKSESSCPQSNGLDLQSLRDELLASESAKWGATALAQSPVFNSWRM